MKKLITALALTAAIISCSQKPQNKFVGPMPASVNISDIKDATVPASFVCAYFDWEDSTLSMLVYNEDIYDSVELHSLALADTLYWNQQLLIVDRIEQKDSTIVINGGLEEGGAEFIPNGGGTYRAILWDDTPTYTKLGEVCLPLAQDFTITDCGEFPTDANLTISTNQRAYLDGLRFNRFYFLNLSTKVQIENGQITNITRTWIP